ncbi:hypothetical protein R7Q39_18685 [Vibrio sp. 947]|uniref:hypothetical protein n=1 Tax=Vibrio TaxID=662 RepID=UPI00296520C9|nr:MULTISPECIES: hypothetical protein [unclassified Vibrio]MDW1583944.1 hypothetical protein [Vibrio sp. Vb2897]MDW1642200.1 hypothetical protein [Vibrio sp. Vb2896]MDW1927456.1 hypothetical protein [Vibrio sp. 947]
MNKINPFTFIVISITFVAYLMFFGESVRFSQDIGASYYWWLVALGIGSILLISKTRKRLGYKYELNELVLSLTIGLFMPIALPFTFLFLDLSVSQVKHQNLGHIVSGLTFIGISSLGFIGSKDANNAH